MGLFHTSNAGQIWVQNGNPDLNVPNPRQHKLGQAKNTPLLRISGRCASNQKAIAPAKSAPPHRSDWTMSVLFALIAPETASLSKLTIANWQDNCERSMESYGVLHLLTGLLLCLHLLLSRSSSAQQFAGRVWGIVKSACGDVSWDLACDFGARLLLFYTDGVPQGLTYAQDISCFTKTVTHAISLVCCTPGWRKADLR